MSTKTVLVSRRGEVFHHTWGSWIISFINLFQVFSRQCICCIGHLSSRSSSHTYMNYTFIIFSIMYSSVVMICTVDFHIWIGMVFGVHIHASDWHKLIDFWWWPHAPSSGAPLHIIIFVGNISSAPQKSPRVSTRLAWNVPFAHSYSGQKQPYWLAMTHVTFPFQSHQGKPSIFNLVTPKTYWHKARIPSGTSIILLLNHPNRWLSFTVVCHLLVFDPTAELL